MGKPKLNKKQKVATQEEVSIAIKEQPKLKETSNKKVVQGISFVTFSSNSFRLQDKKKNQKKIAPVPAPPVVKPAESSDESESDEEPTKPTPVSKPVVANGNKKPNVAAKKAESSDEESDSDDSEEEKPTKLNGKAPAIANGSAKKSTNGNAKKVSESEDDSDSGKAHLLEYCLALGLVF